MIRLVEAEIASADEMALLKSIGMKLLKRLVMSRIGSEDFRRITGQNDLNVLSIIGRIMKDNDVEHVKKTNAGIRWKYFESLAAKIGEEDYKQGV